MNTIAAATISGIFALFAALVATGYQKVRADLNACLHERRQLKQVTQLIVSSLVGLLPANKRDELLVAVANALDGLDEAA